ncbi:MAG: CpsB/CapC family capsule biosynthesis tyrosine phosphatase [Thermodesulfobacteriota bacterium]
MIDIHCHIIPGVDDGPKDLTQALTMARLAVADGIRVIVATPHSLNGVYANHRRDILEKGRILKEAFQESNIPLILFFGADVHFDPDLLSKIEAGEVLPINDGKYILLEIPGQSIPQVVKEVLFDLRVKGSFPILTHLERNLMVQKNPELVGEWVEHGAVIQITAQSLTGDFGGRAYRCACRLLEKGWVDVIASDGHSTRRRPPVLSQGVRKAAEIVGREQAWRMVTHTPELILRSQALPDKSPSASSSQPVASGFFSRLFSF